MTGSDTDPALLRSVAEQLASEAAAFVRRRRTEVFGAGAAGTIAEPTAGAVPAVNLKSTPTDPVTVVDTETERLLRNRLAELRPGERILGEEEGGPVGGVDGQLTWVLDPIDGTKPFIKNLPHYTISLALIDKGEP
ncbi:MAG: inositol monophosphatase, partial [Actinomycetia bacterium]|nr:inositol monophosphatase [Actinomycetes bacterium]